MITNIWTLHSSLKLEDKYIDQPNLIRQGTLWPVDSNQPVIAGNTNLWIGSVSTKCKFMLSKKGFYLFFQEPIKILVEGIVSRSFISVTLFAQVKKLEQQISNLLDPILLFENNTVICCVWLHSDLIKYFWLKFCFWICRLLLISGAMNSPAAMMSHPTVHHQQHPPSQQISLNSAPVHFSNSPVTNNPR